ncbi:hypothetical protein DL771_000721 [Monosporascus sp. 5C6A]|nr:hypothetical protein DL771_000721 [Monosporascus sp. 5C6A]
MGSQQDVGGMSDHEGGKMIFGIPVFRSRWPVKGGSLVVCDGYRRVSIFDREIAKDIPASVQLTKTDLRFLVKPPGKDIECALFCALPAVPPLIQPKSGHAGRRERDEVIVTLKGISLPAALTGEVPAHSLVAVLGWLEPAALPLLLIWECVPDPDPVFQLAADVFKFDMASPDPAGAGLFCAH